MGLAQLIAASPVAESWGSALVGALVYARADDADQVARIAEGFWETFPAAERAILDNESSLVRALGADHVISSLGSHTATTAHTLAVTVAKGAFGDVWSFCDRDQWFEFLTAREPRLFTFDGDTVRENWPAAKNALLGGPPIDGGRLKAMVRAERYLAQEPYTKMAYTAKEIADATGQSDRSVRRKIKDKKIRVLGDHSPYRVHREDAPLLE